MTRSEKLAAVDAKYLPDIETKRLAMENARTNFETKSANYGDKQVEYKNKIQEVNIYYDAQDEIARLQALTEPNV